MALNELSLLGSLLGEGFFADKVVATLTKEKEVMGPQERTILGRIVSSMKRIERGKEHVDTGRLDSEAVESIGAYYKAMISFQVLLKGIGVVDEQKFRTLLDQINKEIQNSLENNRIDPRRLATTIDFFKAVQRGTLSEASRHWAREVEVLQWPTLVR